MAIEKIKNPGGRFGATNPAHLLQKWAKWAELAVLFSWQLQNGPQDFDFFNSHGCRLYI